MCKQILTVGRSGLRLDDCRDKDKLREWRDQIREETRRQKKRERRRQRQQRISPTPEVLISIYRAFSPSLPQPQPQPECFFPGYQLTKENTVFKASWCQGIYVHMYKWRLFSSYKCIHFRLLPSAMKLRRLCFYTCLSVILFTGGVSASIACWDTPPPPPPGPKSRHLPPPLGPKGRHPPPRPKGRHPPPEQTPPLPPADGYCCGWYASYWNAFLF